MRSFVQRSPLWKIFDNKTPVFYLAIRQQSEDLKHLIPGTGPPNYRVSIYKTVAKKVRYWMVGTSTPFQNCSKSTIWNPDTLGFQIPTVTWVNIFSGHLQVQARTDHLGNKLWIVTKSVLSSKEIGDLHWHYRYRQFINTVSWLVCPKECWRHDYIYTIFITVPFQVWSITSENNLL